MEYWGRNLSCHIYDNSSKWYFFPLCIGLRVIRSKSRDFSSFFHSSLSPFIFFPSFIPSSSSFSLSLLTTTLCFSLSIPSYLSSLFFSFFSLPPPPFPPCTSKLNCDLINSHLQPQLMEEILLSAVHLLSLGLMCIDEI